MAIRQWLIQKITDYFMEEGPQQHSHLCNFDRLSHEIRPADVLLVEGRSRVSQIISRVTVSSWTHSSLYIGRIHDIDDPEIRELVHKHFKGASREQLLIESWLGKGTIISPLSNYQDKHIRICRPSGLTHEDAQNVINAAAHQLGNEYAVRHFLDLFRFYLGSRFIPRRWKSVIFDKQDKVTKDVCSTMIAHAFTSIQFPIIPLITHDDQNNWKFIKRNPRLFKPSDFDYSPYFDIIKYPLISLSNKAAYRELPWDEKLMSNDDTILDENTD